MPQQRGLDPGAPVLRKGGRATQHHPFPVPGQRGGAYRRTAVPGVETADGFHRVLHPHKALDGVRGCVAGRQHIQEECALGRPSKLSYRQLSGGRQGTVCRQG